MATKKVTRKELLRDTDEFLTFSGRAALFIREHSQQFSYLGMALVACALIYLGVNTYMKYINKKGQNAYNMAYYSISKNLNPNTESKDFKKSEELFNKVKDEYGLSKVSRLSLPQRAYIKFLDKKYDEAISLYQEFYDEASGNAAYQSLAKMSLAGCYEATGKLDRAIDILKELMAGPEGFFREQAMLNLARVYRLAQQPEKSGEILKEFIEQYKSSPFLPVAKAHLK